MTKQRTDKPSLTKHQPERLNPYLEQILIFIYKFRFLTTRHIQKLMNHKHHHNIMIWLNSLSTNKYLKIYKKAEFKTEPGYYSLGTKGRKYFLEHPEIKDINYSLLDRVWKEGTNSESFKKHCLFLVNIYISLLDLVKSIDNGQGKLHYFSNVDLQGVEQMIYPLPDAYFSIEDKDGNSKRYFLDLFYDYTRWNDMEKRVRQYLRYYDKQLWQMYMKSDFPEIILICPKNASKNNLEKYIQDQYKEKGQFVYFYLSTRDEIQYKGIRKETLHKVEIKNKFEEYRLAEGK